MNARYAKPLKVILAWLNHKQKTRPYLKANFKNNAKTAINFKLTIYHIIMGIFPIQFRYPPPQFRYSPRMIPDNYAVALI